MAKTLHYDTCGACHYAVFDEQAKKYDVNATQYSCHYHPPRGQLVPMQGQGGVQMVNASSRGIVQHGDLACHHYEPRGARGTTLAS